MKRRNLFAQLATPLFAALLLSACGQDRQPDYNEEIMAWRAERLEKLLAPTGYLNQTGLYWLEPGSYSFGAGPDNDLVFPGPGAAAIGELQVDEYSVFMRVNPGVTVHFQDQPVEELTLVEDTADHPVTVTHGSLSWAVLERDGRFALRLRDFEHPVLAAFGPLPYFEINPDYRVEAVLRRYDTPVIADVGTVIDGLGFHPESPGEVEFKLNGQRYSMEAYQSGDRLFYVFGDRTNGPVTYGGGRFLYSDMPGEDGRVVLDFNKAYSPPCAFNDFSTCPVASPRNRLRVAIEAGEKYDADLHYTPAG